MFLVRLCVLAGPNRHGDSPCLEAVLSSAPGVAGWLGRARGALARALPTLLPRPASRTFLPRAAGAELVLKVARELQRRVGAEPPPIHLPPRLTDEGWLLVVPFESAALGEAVLRAIADVLGAFAKGAQLSPEEIAARFDQATAAGAAALPSPAARAVLAEARRRGLYAAALGGDRVSLGQGRGRREIAAASADVDALDGGRVPTVLIAGPPAPEISRGLSRALTRAGFAVGAATREALALPGRPPSRGAYATREGAARIFDDRGVNAALVEADLEAVAREGLPVDHADVTIALGLPAAEVILLARLSRSAAVLTDVAAELPRSFAAERILISEAPKPSHLDGGGRAVFLKRGEAVFARGPERMTIGRANELAALAAAGAAWALGLSPDQAAKALEPGD
jgi:hypothetical protein